MAPGRKMGGLAVLALLGGCEARIGDEPGGNRAAAGADVSAEGKAEEGRLSVKAPGLDLKLDVPGGLGGKAEFDSDSRILYPGAKLGGLHVEAAGKETGGASAVEMRFTSPDAPARIAAWYRDPARAAGFALAEARQEGAGWAISGTEKENGDPFTVRLAPGAAGGTDGRLVLRHGE